MLFGPMHERMKAAGVKFRFFREVLELVPSGSSGGDNSIGEVRVRRQATVRKGDDGYEPLLATPAGSKDGIGLRGVWPQTPDWSQLEEGEELRKRGTNLESFYDPWPGVADEVYRHGIDYDDLVLAIPAGAHAVVAAKLALYSPAWSDHLDTLETVATCAVQLWLNRTTYDLGFESDPSATRQNGKGSPALTNETTLTGLNLAADKMLNTWSDMTHLLRDEEWPSRRVGGAPRALAYFCGPFPGFVDLNRSNHTVDTRATARVKEVAHQTFDPESGIAQWLWPSLDADPKSRGVWPALYDPLSTAASPQEGLKRFDSQYWRANVGPSERYVLSPPGSIEKRIDARNAVPGITNLYVAGDWVLNGVNSGCAESAVTGGMLAARAVSGQLAEGGPHGPQVRPRNSTYTSYFDLFGPPMTSK